MPVKIPEVEAIPEWSFDDANEIEIGLGIDHRRKCAVVHFDRFVRSLRFDAERLDEIIGLLEKQRDALRAGPPDGH
jgi:hypothetical protein